MLPSATAVSAGESQATTGPSLSPATSWGNDLSSVSTEAGEGGDAWSDSSRADQFDAGEESVDGASTDNFVPLLATEQSRSLSATRGIADSAAAGLLDPESSASPAVVPLPASVWAGLAVLLTTVWLGRHPKRRLRLPI